MTMTCGIPTSGPCQNQNGVNLKAELRLKSIVDPATKQNNIVAKSKFKILPPLASSNMVARCHLCHVCTYLSSVFSS